MYKLGQILNDALALQKNWNNLKFRTEGVPTINARRWTCITYAKWMPHEFKAKHFGLCFRSYICYMRPKDGTLELKLIILVTWTKVAKINLQCTPELKCAGGEYILHRDRLNKGWESCMHQKINLKYLFRTGIYGENLKVMQLN